jgi:MerR HTH family regulatory protein
VYSLADLARLTGAKRRTIQFWAEAGALEAASETERKGAGVHREFSKDELLIACVLNRLFRFNASSIGTLIEVASMVRASLIPKYFREIIYDAVYSNVKAFFIISEDKTVFFYRDCDDPTSLADGFAKMRESNAISNVICLNHCFTNLKIAEGYFRDE